MSENTTANDINIELIMKLIREGFIYVDVIN